MALSERQAYEAMIDFLARHYRRSGSDELGSLLGDLAFLDDGSSADPAAFEEWKLCASAARRDREGQEAAE